MVNSTLLIYRLTVYRDGFTAALRHFPCLFHRDHLYTNSSVYNDFGRYDGADDQRLYIHIANPNSEQVFLGFSQPAGSGHYPCNNATLIYGYFRIKDPSGRVVFPVKDNPNGQLLVGNTANITSYNQAIAGPQPIAGVSGYAPFVFDPSGLPCGDYYIEFSRNSNAVSLNNPVSIEWFDITVATKTIVPIAIEGRLFSRNWALFTPSISCGTNADYTWFDRPFNGKFFVYTNENMVSKVNFEGAGFQPAAFNSVYNDAGSARTGNVIEDRKSRNGIRASSSQHRIFLNNPDINVYPSGVLGQFSLRPQLISCENGASCVEAVVTEPGQIDVLIDLDRTSGNFIYDVDSRDVLIAFKVEPIPGEKAPYVRCIPWDGIDGLGNPVIKSDPNDLFVRYTQGIYHFPVYDAEFMLNGFDVTTIRPMPNNGSPKRIYYDDTNIPDTYGIGINQPKLNPFNGCDLPCHPWTSKDFGDSNTINNWFFAREETSLQLDFGDCPINAFNDTTTTNFNTSKSIAILENDFGVENIDTTNITIGISPINGTVAFDTTNLTTIYNPNSDFIGTDSFTYIICYEVLPVGNLCDSAFVFVTIFTNLEDCENSIDDDGDGLIDCDDPDCLPNIPVEILRKKG